MFLRFCPSFITLHRHCFFFEWSIGTACCLVPSLWCLSVYSLYSSIVQEHKLVFVFVETCGKQSGLDFPKNTVKSLSHGRLVHSHCLLPVSFFYVLLLSTPKTSIDDIFAHVETQFRRKGAPLIGFIVSTFLVNLFLRMGMLSA
jgi:hypothetical protein